MAVVAHHAFDGDTRLGAAGVDLFFVISGFIMATAPAAAPPANSSPTAPGGFIRCG
jgi:peptidoglycan/LPS O-acetylase OafA/YrhL